MREKKPRKHPLIQQNLLDKLITYIDPKRGQMRLQARAQLAVVGGYTGARRDKSTLSTWNPGAGSPTTDAIADLPALRERSRDEMRNSGVASGALNGAVTGIVGTGLTATPSINAQLLGLTSEEAKAWNEDAAVRFEAWASSEECDVSRTNDFYAIQELAQRAWLESGDAFVLTPKVKRASGTTRLALQLIEGDRVCNPTSTPDSDSLIEGVEIDPITQAPVAYHFSKHHPGDRWSGINTWTREPARGVSSGRKNVLHLFKQHRPGQVRGMPWISSIIEPLKQLDRWTENELNAAVTSSIFSVFAKMDANAFTEIFDEEGESQKLLDERSKWTGGLENGKVINLLPGEELGSVSSTRPNPAFDPFWVASSDRLVWRSKFHMKCL